MKEYPQLGEIFELTLDDSDIPENPLRAMLEASGHNPSGWNYHGGKLVLGKQIRRFKLVQKGGRWDDIGKVTGNALGGQWIEAFKKAYPKPDGDGYIGVHDASWVHPLGYDNFPFICESGDLHICWIGGVFDGRWHWLVRVEEKSRGRY